MVYGIDTAIKFELPFRSGATIRALQELWWTKEPNSEESKQFANTLSNVPLVMIVDSKKAENNYCNKSGAVFNTNIDDIVELIKDYPVRVEGQIGEDIGIEGLADWVSKSNPALLVLHIGAFEGLDIKE
jgi:hypothetical protein